MALSLSMAAGLVGGNFELSLFAALGALNCAMIDSKASYRARFRQMTIASLVGTLGFLLGHLQVLPFLVVIFAMGLVAFACGIIGSYGAAWATGAMNVLVYSSIAIGVPAIAPFWQPAALSLLGAVLYLVLLGVEALLDRRRPERELLVQLLDRLAALARLRTGAARPGPPSDAMLAAQRAVTDRLNALNAEILSLRVGGRTHETEILAQFLDAADGVYAAVMAADDSATLTAAADWLAGLAAAIASRAVEMPALPAATTGARGTARSLSDATLELAAAAVSGALVLRGGPSLPRLHLPRGELSLPHLRVGRRVLMNAAALGLCSVLAYAVHELWRIDHWYWVPLTVALVMRPDLGSVYWRALLRSLGTAVGVLIGVGILMLVPPGYPMVLVLGLFGALLPYAKGINYAAQMFVITPLILVLLDLMVPASQARADALMLMDERFFATLIGGAIVLVFGYFLWPRRRTRALAQQFDQALGATAAYLQAAYGTPAADRAQVGAAERQAYRSLSDLRADLSRAMAEPPPAGREAAAWYPLVASAERLCDRITAHAPAEDGPRPPADQLAHVAARLRRLVAGAQANAGADDSPALPDDPNLRGIAGEVAQIQRRLGAVLAAERPRRHRLRTAPAG